MWVQTLSPGRRNIYLFYLLTAAMNCWFIASNWIYFWTRIMTFGQLGWIDALGFGFGMILEIPSGAIADLLGKRKTILFGLTAGAVGVYVITFSSTLLVLFIGWLITQICFAFYSGAAEALAYDTLVENHEEKQFDHVISKSNEIANYTGAAATLIGGFLFTIHYQLPHFLWGTSFLIGAVLAWFLIEPKVDTIKFSFRTYMHQLIIGFKELMSPELRKYVGFFLALVGMYFLYTWGFIRPAIATSFGFFSKEQAVILPLLAIYGAVIVRSIPYFKKRISDFQGLLILSVILAGGFFLSAFPIGYYGLIPMILIATAGYLATPWISIIVNNNIQSKYRATTLSTLALLTKLPYVLIAVIAGKMIEEGHLSTFNLAVAGTVMGAAVISSLIMLLSRNRKISSISAQ